MLIFPMLVPAVVKASSILTAVFYDSKRMLPTIETESVYYTFPATLADAGAARTSPGRSQKVLTKKLLP